MEPAACALAALRLAPVQVASWGHPVTTGMPNIDIYLSGELIEGPQAERHYREKLVRLPGTGVCTEFSGLHPLPWDAPIRPPDAVRFAICQQPIKFDPADDGLLVRITKEAGACEFWLASPLKLQWAATRLHNRLAAVFRDAGLDPDAHLRVTSWLPCEQFLGFPRQDGCVFGLSRLLGVTEGIVNSREAYVETAVHFALRCRAPKARARCRESMSAAAAKADGSLAAVRSIERALIAAVEAQR
jgi:protein O-GlcNAc transferase